MSDELFDRLDKELKRLDKAIPKRFPQLITLLENGMRPAAKHARLSAIAGDPRPWITTANVVWEQMNAVLDAGAASDIRSAMSRTKNVIEDLNEKFLPETKASTRKIQQKNAILRLFEVGGQAWRRAELAVHYDKTAPVEDELKQVEAAIRSIREALR